MWLLLLCFVTTLPTSSQPKAAYLGDPGGGIPRGGIPGGIPGAPRGGAPVIPGAIPGGAPLLIGGDCVFVWCERSVLWDDPKEIASFYPAGNRFSFSVVVARRGACQVLR